MAELLCVGSSTKYELKERSRVSDVFLLTNVCPNICCLFPRPMTILFGKAVLWGICDDILATHLPTGAMVTNVRLSMRNLHDELNVNENSVAKVLLLMISGEEASDAGIK